MEQGGDGGGHNEAISAVQDEEQLYREDDEDDDDNDCNDLYSDVNFGHDFLKTGLHKNNEVGEFQQEEEKKNYGDANVSEGFLQTVHKNDEVGRFQHEEEKRNNSPPPPSPPNVQTPSVVSGTTLSIKKLQWWTKDAELEEEVSKYGKVKDMLFMGDKPSGRSNGKCLVEFYDPMAAAACKKGMEGRVFKFNGRPCAVDFASPIHYHDQAMAQSQPPAHRERPDRKIENRVTVGQLPPWVLHLGKGGYEGGMAPKN